MKSLILFVIMLAVLSTNISFAQKVVPLPDILNPEHMKVDKNHIYITEGEKIFIYSRNELKLKHKFGKKGEGPGSFRVYPIMGVRITVQPECLMVKSIGRISYFTLDGKYIKEVIMRDAFSNFLTARSCSPLINSNCS